MGFNEEYNKILELVKPDIAKVTDDLVSEINLNDPLNSSLKNLLTAPSKHIRTLLAFLYLKTNNIEINDRQIYLQSAVELIHNASLIHDDIIDESPTRRNIQTIHSEFDNKLAVISGDYLLAAALRKISTLNNSTVTELFSDIMKTMCGGEINQYFSKYQKISLSDYITKSQQKTAALFQAAIESAAILSGNLSRTAAKDFAINFGTAFQIRDDLINFKTTKSDLNAGIYTAPVILAENSSDISDGIEKTIRLLNNYIDKSYDIIKKLDENPYKLAIVELLELFRHD